ncbi:MAG: cell shape-determining protein MreC, partial [Paraglaciecola sp.]
MASNKNLATSLVAFVIFGLVSSVFEPNILPTQVADTSPTVIVSAQSTVTQPADTGLTVTASLQFTETQPENLRQELTSYIEFTQLDQGMLQPILVLFFLA